MTRLNTGGLEFGRLSLGAANAGNLYRTMSDDDARAVFEAAWDEDVRAFDTAPHYGLGLSERRLGAFLRGKPRNEYVVSTKVGRLLVPDPSGADRRDDWGFDVPATYRRVLDYTESGVRRSLEDSLERMGLDSVDILYVHDPEYAGTEDARGTALAALRRMKDEGLVRAIGIGSMDTAALRAAVRAGGIDLIMLAGRYTLLEQPALHEIVPECLAAGIRIVNTAVFNSGLLARGTPSADSHYDNGAVPHDKLERARRLASACSAHGVELPAAALQYTLRDPSVATVLVGAASAEQVRENARRMAEAIPDELWAQLAEEGLIPA